MEKTKTKVHKLDACPFCGWKAKLDELRDKSEEKRFWVECTNNYSSLKGKCAIKPGTILCKTAQTAARIWNKRFEGGKK
jgi:hypothetical protein